MEVAVVPTSFGDIEYSRYGSEQAILFIHGGHSNAREHLTHKHIDPNEFVLITPSRPGYGKTTLNGNESPTTASQQIMELMDFLQIDKFDVIGISAGGLTAIALVSSNPHRVRRFVLTSAISKRWLYPDDSTYRRANKMFNPTWERITWSILHWTVKWFPRLIIGRMAAELTSIPIGALAKEEILDVQGMLLKQRSQAGFMADLDHDLDSSILGSISTPTLIVHSKNDQAVPMDHARNAHQGILEAKLILVENRWGHLIWVGQESREIIDQVVSFLRCQT